MWRSRLKLIGGFFLTAILCAPAWGANTARPGTLNYVEGQASIDTQPLTAKSVGSAELGQGQSLITEKGKAEILLTPGVFLRLDDNSSVKMIAPGLTNTELTVEKGRAMVEVANIHRENDLRISEDGVTTQLVKNGVYDFDADRAQVRVFDGKALVQEGDRQVEVKGGHEVNLNAGGEMKAQKFDKKSYEDDFYRWASLRSSYLAEANVEVARTYVGGGPGWFGPGWYWDPWFGAYTFVPGDGIFYSPFGWGFYSPFWVYRAPVVVYSAPYYRHFGPGYHYWSSGGGAIRAPARGFHPGSRVGAPRVSGGFRGGANFHGGVRR